MSTSVSMTMFLSLTFIVIIIIPAASSLSFDISLISQTDSNSFKYEGDAYVTTDGIQLTTNERDKPQNGRIGRATYAEPLHLWDRASNELADFSTHFSFIIYASNRTNFGDGLAFFLAPKGSAIKPWSGGGSLGLGNVTSSIVDSPSSMETFVAVEFDTYPNSPFDPPQTFDGGLVMPHVGIDLNNVTSVANTTWYNNITANCKNDAWISYNSSAKMLMVNFTGCSRGKTQAGNLSYEVDLRDYLPEYVTVGFSAATGDSIEIHNVVSWNFSSTDVSSSSKSNSSTDVSSSSKSNDKKTLILVLSGAGITLVILASTFTFCFLRNKKKKEKKKEQYEGLEEEQLSDSAMDDEFEKGNGPKRFSYNELVVATDDFAAEQKLGEGGFGCVYKGFLRTTNTYIAVKKVSEGSKQGRKEYEAEVKIISQLRHVNLVELIGWCHRRAELLLVYEFMPNGSLDSYLFKVNSLLTWEMRWKIAEGLASAVLYLHEGLRQYVVHRDIKSSNVMLDSNFNAKLGDFGLARLVDRDKDLHSTTPAGTIGYMAPEYLNDWRASKETDMYSFGILLLEIACGRRPIDHRYPQTQIVLVEWVWSLYGGGQLLDAADAKVDSSVFEARKIERLMVVGLWCVHPDSAQRPSIRQVVQVLNSEDGLPELPLAMPKAVYNNMPRVVTAASSTSNTYSSGHAFSTDSGISGQGSTASNLTTSSASSTSHF